MKTTKTTFVALLLMVLVMAYSVTAQDSPPAPPLDLDALAVITPDNAARLQPLRRFEMDTSYPSALIAPTNDLVVMARSSQWIDFWDIRTGQIESIENPTTQSFNLLEISPDGTTLMATSGGVIYLLNMATRQQMAQLPDHEMGVTWIVFSPDSKTLATTDGYAAIATGLIFLWDVATGELLGTLAEPGSDEAGYWNALAFDPRNGNLLSVINQTVYLWDIETQTVAQQLYDPAFSLYGLRAQYLDNGTSIVAYSSDWLHIMDPELSETISTLPMLEGGSYYQATAISADGSRLATASSSGITFLRTLLPEPALVRQWPVPGAAMAFTPDGSLLIVGAEDGRTVLWDREGERVHVFTLFDEELELIQLAFSPNGKLLLVASRTTGADSGSLLEVWGVPAD